MIRKAFSSRDENTPIATLDLAFIFSCGGATSQPLKRGPALGGCPAQHPDLLLLLGGTWLCYLETGCCAESHQTTSTSCPWAIMREMFLPPESNENPRSLHPCGGCAGNAHAVLQGRHRINLASFGRLQGCHLAHLPLVEVVVIVILLTRRHVATLLSLRCTALLCLSASTRCVHRQS